MTNTVGVSNHTYLLSSLLVEDQEGVANLLGYSGCPQFYKGKKRFEEEGEKLLCVWRPPRRARRAQGNIGVGWNEDTDGEQFLLPHALERAWGAPLQPRR